MSKLPAFQFYPSDWRNDVGVQSLNFFERGVWFEMLCLMHLSEQRGKLLLNGKMMSEDALARLLGLDKQALSKTLAILIDFGVCSQDESGVLFSRRMVKDEAERQANAERQKRFYKKHHLFEEPNGQPNDDLTEIQREANNASSSSSSSSNGGGPKPPRPSQDKYLEEKQKEYPLLNIKKVFGRYLEFCEKKEIDPKRRVFDKWLENEEEPMTASFETVLDISKCPDCNGEGMIFEGKRGARICQHERLKE
jgi:hypothetical protein